MTCKDCLSENVCAMSPIREKYSDVNIEKICELFKNKADFVEVKHAKWLKKRNMYECSICSNTIFANGISGFNYCHGCGARMDGKRSDKE